MQPSGVGYEGSASEGEVCKVHWTPGDPLQTGKCSFTSGCPKKGIYFRKTSDLWLGEDTFAKAGVIASGSSWFSTSLTFRLFHFYKSKRALNASEILSWPNAL